MSIAPTAPGTLELAEEFGLSRDEYDLILEKVGRPINATELGIFSVMWSEHCSYKSSRVHLAKFPTKAPHVIYGPGENAGAIDIGGGLAAIFKMESHNHPSFIEPYQGAATGVGGILRDVFTMGARPVAIMNALRFGDPSHPKTRRLVEGVVSGIAGYGNCVGVPTVGGETNFHARYNGNILVNVFCLGIAPRDRIFTSAAKGAGNPVVYVGAKTGRDGIHGATMASAEFVEGDDSQRPTVQVGDPFLEKLLIEGCLELMESDAIIGIQDMGAAGLTSSSVEMASKGGAGILLDLDTVPAREEGMTPYDFMLSESQERMLMVLKPGREADAKAIFDKWGLDAAVIGRTTDTGNLTLRWHGEIVCDLPLGPLADEAPKYERPYVPRSAADSPKYVQIDTPPVKFAEALSKLMASPDQASKRWIWEQYDRDVMTNTIADSGADAAIIRLPDEKRALAMTCDVTPRYVEADPYEGGKQAVAEAWRNLCAVGARPLAVTDNLNFGNPQRPEIMGQIVAAIEGMAEACRALDFPVISGNVSLYNETDGQAILPTPAIGGVGILENLERRASVSAMEAGDLVILAGLRHSRGHLGQSIFLRDVHGHEEGPPPPVDLAHEKRVGDFVRALIAEGMVKGCHDLSDGGLAVAAAEMALASDMGVALGYQGEGADADFLFGEDQGRYLVALPPAAVAMFEKRARAAGVEYLVVGEAGGREISYLGLDGARDAIALDALRRLNEEWLPAYMQGAR